MMQNENTGNPYFAKYSKTQGPHSLFGKSALPKREHRGPSAVWGQEPFTIDYLVNRCKILTARSRDNVHNRTLPIVAESKSSERT